MTFMREYVARLHPVSPLSVIGCATGEGNTTVIGDFTPAASPTTLAASISPHRMFGTS